MVLDQYPAPQKIGDVAQRRVGRASFDGRPFRRRELAVESVEQPVQHVALPLVQRIARMLLPESRLLQHTGENAFRALERARQARKKPRQPRGNVEIALLRPFENLIIRLPLLPDLRGHAVEALRAPLRARKLHVGDGARDTPVAVVEG